MRNIEAEVNWRLNARCKDIDPDVFFPEEIVPYPSNSPTPALKQRRREVELAALLVCQNCPVKAECLEDGRNDPRGHYGDVWGIRGGLLPADRAAYYRRTGQTVDVVSG